jgi:hypothetical protein
MKAAAAETGKEIKIGVVMVEAASTHSFMEYREWRPRLVTWQTFILSTAIIHHGTQL